MSAAAVARVDVSDWTPGQMGVVELGGRAVLLCNADGEFFAVDHRCSHVGVPLLAGRLVGTILECPLHGARFDVRDGRAVRRPATQPLATYPVSVRDGRAEIRLPAAAASE